MYICLFYRKAKIVKRSSVPKLKVLKHRRLSSISIAYCSCSMLRTNSRAPWAKMDTLELVNKDAHAQESCEAKISKLHKRIIWSTDHGSCVMAKRRPQRWVLSRGPPSTAGPSLGHETRAVSH